MSRRRKFIVDGITNHRLNRCGFLSCSCDAFFRSFFLQQITAIYYTTLKAVCVRLRSQFSNYLWDFIFINWNNSSKITHLLIEKMPLFLLFFFFLVYQRNIVWLISYNANFDWLFKRMFYVPIECRIELLLVVSFSL